MGTGKSLAPPAPPPHQRSSSLNSQHARSSSALSVSSSSRGSARETVGSPLAMARDTSPMPELGRDRDLSSKVSLENGSSSVAAASMRLLCPICNDEMVGLFCFVLISRGSLLIELTLDDIAATEPVS